MPCCNNNRRSSCNDPTVHICGCANTENVGNIPMLGPCSYPNTQGFLKKHGSFDKYGGAKYKISIAYDGDITPMFGIKAAFDKYYPDTH